MAVRPCLDAVDGFYVLKDTVRAVAHAAGLKATFVAKLGASSPPSLAVVRIACSTPQITALFSAGLSRHAPALQALRFASSNAFGALTSGASKTTASHELSCDQAASNMYLLLAAAVQCGIEGVLLAEPPAAAEEKLAADLAGALAALEADPELSKMEWVPCFLAIKRVELEVKTTLPVLLERF